MQVPWGRVGRIPAPRMLCGAPRPAQRPARDLHGPAASAAAPGPGPVEGSLEPRQVGGVSAFAWLPADIQELARIISQGH